MQENEKIIRVRKDGKQPIRTRRIWQYDRGHVLQFEGFELPETFQVHFALSMTGEATTQIGQNDVCVVPDMYTQSSGTVYAWVYVADEETGLTKQAIEIPVEYKAEPTDQEPTPVQESAVDQAIAALNGGVTRAETAAGAAEAAQEAAEGYAESAGNSAITATNAASSAGTAAGSAAASATAAANSATDAAASREAADVSATNAGVSERNAAGSATAAAGSATNAAASAGQAGQSAEAAAGSARAAQTAAAGVESAQAAAASAQAAAGSATAAAGSATAAGTAKTGAESAQTAAAGSATAAAGSATQAAGSATAAAGSAAAAAQTKAEMDAEVEQIQTDLSNLNSAITNKQNKPQTAGTAGQVLGLDENLDPVWVDQSGGAVDDSALAPVIKATASGEIASFADGAENRQIDSLVVNIEPVQSGSGDPAPDNVRPISGWTGANIQRAGKNLFPSTARWYNARRYSQDQSAPSVVQIENDTEVVFPASANVAQVGWCKAVPCKAGQTYTLKYYGEKSYRMNIAEYANLTDAHDYTKAVSAASSTVNNTVTYTAVNDGLLLCAVLGYSSSNLATLDGTEESQLELGSEATDYKPYNGTSVSVDWADEAGTVYGAKLDVISGVLTVYHAERTLTGNETWYAYTSFEGFNWRDSGMKPGNRHNGICNWLPTASDSDLGVPSAWFGAGATNAYIYAVHVWDLIGITGSESTADMVTAWKAYLAEHPLQVVYPLAEPIVYHLTPHEVLTLLGQNNIFADCGSIESVEYSADTKLYSDSHAAPVKDVQVNGTSVLSNGVANVPLASNSTVGVAKFRTDFGLQFNTSLQSASIFPATDGNIKAGTNAYRPIVVNSQHLATFYGLAKAAGDTTQSASSNAVGTYTDEAKAKIKEMLGLSPDWIQCSRTTWTKEESEEELAIFAVPIGETVYIDEYDWVVYGYILASSQISRDIKISFNGNTVAQTVYISAVTAALSHTKYNFEADIKIDNGVSVGDAICQGQWDSWLDQNITLYGPVQRVATRKPTVGGTHVERNYMSFTIPNVIAYDILLYRRKKR